MANPCAGLTWRRRAPAPTGGPPLAPGALNDSLSARPGPAINPYGAGMPRGAGGPQIFSPQGSNIGTGKEVGSWTNPSTDATPSPQMMADLAKARGLSLPAFLRSNPIAAFLYSTLYSTPAETGEYHPGAHHPGGPPMPVPPAPAPIDPYGPTAMPTASAPLPPIRPTAAPTPTVRPKIDPKAVDLGYYRPSVGNARTPTYVPAGQTQAPDIFRGLLAQRPT